MGGATSMLIRMTQKKISSSRNSYSLESSLNPIAKIHMHYKHGSLKTVFSLGTAQLITKIKL